MNEEKMIVPSKKEVEKLLIYITNNNMFQLETIGELLGCKLIDSLLSKGTFKTEWGYEGLVEFFKKYKIESSDTFKEALDKLK